MRTVSRNLTQKRSKCSGMRNFVPANLPQSSFFVHPCSIYSIIYGRPISSNSPKFELTQHMPVKTQWRRGAFCILYQSNTGGASPSLLFFFEDQGCENIEEHARVLDSGCRTWLLGVRLTCRCNEMARHRKSGGTGEERLVKG